MYYLFQGNMWSVFNLFVRINCIRLEKFFVSCIGSWKCFSKWFATIFGTFYGLVILSLPIESPRKKGVKGRKCGFTYSQIFCPVVIQLILLSFLKY